MYLTLNNLSSVSCSYARHKTWCMWEVQLHPFLTLTRWVSGQLHASAVLSQGKRRALLPMKLGGSQRLAGSLTLSGNERLFIGRPALRPVSIRTALSRQRITG